jgi:Tol biopolymer transport system component
VPLPPGTRVGPYEIRSLIGSGGMGEVYRATDVRLQRDVALKVLPTAMAADRAWLDRFEQEARATAALNHPNIVAAYDVGTFDGAPYVVSELLEGGTLRDEVAKSAPLSPRTVIEYGQQVARGLSAAHHRGIVHRDLKPENIFVTRDRHLKILDFGLAKLTAPEPSTLSSATAPTYVETAAGTVLGSNGYMAPEQVRALPVDHRADIFSFGAILFELLTGQRAFTGATPADVATAILKDEPASFDLLQTHAPPGLVLIIERCLEKTPNRRFQSASDLAFALDALSGSGHGGERASARPSIARFAPALLLGGALFAAAGWLAMASIDWLGTAASSDAVVGRFGIAPPGGGRFSPPGRSSGPHFALSPDGQSVAFVAYTGGDSAVWLRPLDALNPVKLAGTEGAVGSPFWAPDGSSIAFFAQASLKALELATGSARTICQDLPAFSSLEGTWGRAGTILITGVPAGVILCPASGGARRITSMWFNPSIPASAMTGIVSHPQFLSDGRHFIFASRTASPEHNGVLVSALAGDGRLEPPTQLLADRSVASYSSGQLFFVRDGVLMAQAFDEEELRLTGEPRSLTQSVEFVDARLSRIEASPSVVLYSTGQVAQSALRWLTAGGAASEVLPSDQYGDFALSRDGTQLAVVRRDLKLQTARISLMDLAGGRPRRIGSDADGAASNPVWSPDNRFVAYARHSAGRSSLVVASASGGAVRELLVDPSASYRMDAPSFIPHDWSPDSTLLSYSDITGQLFVLPIANEPTPMPVLQASSVWGSAFSPDGMFIAYATREDASIYVEPWPSTGRRSRISRPDGGVEPRWSRDGRALFYRTSRGDIVRAPITASGSAVAMPQVVLRTMFDTNPRQSYFVAPDGRFLVKQSIEHDEAIISLINWVTAVKTER